MYETASEDVITCQGSTFTPNSASFSAYCLGVFVPLFVAKTYFSLRASMLLKIADKSPIGASDFQMTPSMSRMRAFMLGGSINIQFGDRVVLRALGRTYRDHK